MGRVAEHLRNMVRILNSLDSRGYNIIMSKELMDLSKASGEALVSLMKNNTAFDKKKLEQLVQDMDNRLLDIRKEGLTSRFDIKRLLQVFSFFNSLKYFAEDIISGADKILSNTPTA
jgi:acetyl-CoA carboxylase carboxyltransferase component